jgi:hypothetical protein
VVIAAEQYAAGMVLPASQRTHRQHWASHNDLAAKALKKLAGPHLPASLRELEKAVKRAHAEYDTAVRRAEDHARPELAADSAAEMAEDRIDTDPGSDESEASVELEDNDELEVDDEV